MEEPRVKRQRSASRLRDFTGATAIDVAAHYHVRWRDFDECLEFLLSKRKWLLITGPFQSGKSSLAHALSEAAQAQGFVSVVTTLSSDMVDVANDSSVTDVMASNAFFGLLADALEERSGGELKQASAQVPGGFTQVQRMFRKPAGGDPDVLWFIDEAALLNEIKRPNILRSVLGGLRACKELSRAGGTLRLRSFSLVGTAKTRQLLASAKQQRVDDTIASGEVYVPASPAHHGGQPAARHDSYHPFHPGLPISPLSLEKNRGADSLDEADILGMLRRYAQDHGVNFQMRQEEIQGSDARALENERTLKRLATDIYELTSGYKGLVGSCCEYIQGNSVRFFTRWTQDLRRGAVAAHVLNFKVYSRIVSNIPTYSQELQQLILDCVSSPSSGCPYAEALGDLVLPAVNDGVLSVDASEESVSISSAILLAAILQDCDQATAENVPAFGTFEDAVRHCFRYMQPDRLSRDEVLNHNGQPSEYIWTSEFLLALKLVLTKGYRTPKYTILVECKKRNKQGERKMRVDLYLKNSGSPPKAFELQAKGGAKSIKAHICKSEKYRLLFTGCEMNYVYFVFGEDPEAKAVIEQESKNFSRIKCWFVQYLDEHRVWNVELLHESGWHAVQLDLPSSYPQFKFATRQF